MGTCASSQHASKGGDRSWQSSVSIIHLDGRLQQLKEPVKAWQVLSQNPNCFICCSESMFVGSLMAPVAPREELQLDRIYFLVPLSESRKPLSLQDLCALAIKANAALAPSKATNSILKSSSKATNPILKSSSISKRNFLTHPVLPIVSQGLSN